MPFTGFAGAAAVAVLITKYELALALAVNEPAILFVEGVNIYEVGWAEGVTQGIV